LSYPATRLRRLLNSLESPLLGLFRYSRLFEKLLNPLYLVKELLIIRILRLEILDADSRLAKKAASSNSRALGIYASFIE
jgi:hypothetical protein